MVSWKISIYTAASNRIFEVPTFLWFTIYDDKSCLLFLCFVLRQQSQQGPLGYYTILLKEMRDEYSVATLETSGVCYHLWSTLSLTNT
jgi:hypothetical protein